MNGKSTRNGPFFRSGPIPRRVDAAMACRAWLFAGCALLAGWASAANEDNTAKAACDNPTWRPLSVDLPPPVFTGTPQNLFTPNLESPEAAKTPEVTVPPETENVAKGKLVTSDVLEPRVGELRRVTDGIKEAAFAHIVELPEGPHYIQLDLEQPCEIYAVALWHYHSEARVYFDVMVLASNDRHFHEDVHVLFNNDHDNSLGRGIGDDKEYIETNAGKVIPAEGVTGRYVRLYSNGNTSNDYNHYVEVAVYGRPAADT